MKVVQSPDALSITDGIVCIGNFDGVHLGHQMLLSHMQERCEAQSRPGVIISFFPPARVLFQNSHYLSDEAEKLALFAPFRPDAVVMIPFTKEYAKTDKRVFLEQLERLAPHMIIVGEDFRFGHKRSGTLNDLSHIPDLLEVFSMKKLQNDTISSSRIREALKAGDVAQARAFLGHDYSASGVVLKGEQRGRLIGFPTANIDVAPQKALPIGVFAVTVKTNEGIFYGMANVGPRPSFPEAPPSLEVHLFDFNADLYGQCVTVNFKHFIRHQVKFSGLDALMAQLKTDKQTALSLLS